MTKMRMNAARANLSHDVDDSSARIFLTSYEADEGKKVREETASYRMMMVLRPRIFL